MGGIVRGFLAGASSAMADMGKMVLADQLQKEREEANFLRESDFRKTMQSDSQSFQASETTRTLKSREKTAEADRKQRAKTAADKMASDERIADIRAKSSGKDNRSSQQKNIDDLMARGKTLTEAIQLVYPNATIKHTDAEGNQIVVVQTDKGFEEIGKIMINDAGEQEWVAAGDEPTRTKPTKEELQAKADAMNKDEGRGDDFIPFNEYSPTDKEVKDAAKKDLAGGVVNKAKDTKKIGGRDMSKQQFIDAMVARYGKGAMDDILSTWEGIK